MFTLAEKTFLIKCYFRNGRKVNGIWIYSIDECIEDFRNNFSNAAFTHQQFTECLKRCVTNFREKGSIIQRNGGRPTICTEEIIAEASNIMHNESKTSVRHLSQQITLSYGTCQKLLHKDLNLYPYRLTSLPELLPQDIPARLSFCHWFLNTFNNNEDVLRMLFFTDEAW